MPHFSCYLPEGLLQQLDQRVRTSPGTRSGIMRVALEKYLEPEPNTVRAVFEEAMKDPNPIVPKIGSSRSESFRRATQR